MVYGERRQFRVKTSVLVAIGILIESCTITTSPSVPSTTGTSVATTTTVLLGSPGTPDLGDELFPGLGNGGFDVTRYQLEIDLTSDSGELSGKATIEAVALQNLSAFNLDLFEMEVSQVMVDDQPAQFGRAAGEIMIEPATTIREGDRFSASVEYNGEPQAREAPSTVFSPGLLEAEDGTRFAFNEPNGASTWFPANDHPSDRAVYVVAVTMPTDQVAVSQGRLVSDVTAGDKRIMTYESLVELSTYQLALGVGDLVATEVTDVDLPVTLWAPPDAAGLEVFERWPQMIEFFTELFGPIPVSTYGALIVDEELPAALETRGLPTFTQFSLGFGDEILAHELAHEWFGNHVVISDWSEIWLNEGFATFATWLWLQDTDGRSAYDQRIKDAYWVISGLNRVEELGAREADSTARAAFPPPGSPIATDLFNASVYLRGALTVAALRDHIGDDVFNGLLRTYLQRYGGQTVETSDLIALASEAAGEDLSDFFDGWLYQPRIPAMKVRDLQPPV